MLFFMYLAVCIAFIWFLKWCKIGISGWIIPMLVVAVIMIPVLLYKRINPGEVGVVVNLFGSHKGVEEKELNVGYHFISPWESLYLFPIFEQNHQWLKDDSFTFQTSEGLSVDAEIGITFNLVPSKIHELFCKYRRGMDEITHLFIRNNIRDAINRRASRLKIEEILGPRKEEFFNDIIDDVRGELDPLGFHISHVYIIGQLNVPPIVMEALNKKIEATQRAQQRENELREAEAQAKKEIAQVEGQAKSQVIESRAKAESRMMEAKADADSRILKATAEAKSNEMLNKTLNADLLEWQKINKWDGSLPTTMSGSAVPFINVGN